MFCDNCGAQLREDAKFCHVCGARLLLETTDTPMPEPVIQPPAAVQTEKREDPVVDQDSPSEDSPVQPLSGTFSWENVKISGEFKDGVGTLTITFR